MDTVTFRPGPPRLLHMNPETIEKFRQLGLLGASYRVCGEALNVSKDTVANFLHRHSPVMEVYRAALGEYRAKEASEQMARTAAKREKAKLRAAPAARPKPGEICPTCGQRAGEAPETVTLTTAELAEGRRKFEDLIDRHLSAPPAPPHEGDRQ